MSDRPLLGLISRALAGDAEAFGELIERYERAMLSAAYAGCGDAALAADAVQEACLRAWQKRHTLAEPNCVGPWLINIARRCGADQVRRGPWRRAFPLEGEVDRPVEADCPVEMAEAEQERQRRVGAALQALDEPTRVAVAMRYFDGASSRQIADTLGCSPAAVDMRLKRARDRLRHLLDDLLSPGDV